MKKVFLFFPIWGLIACNYANKQNLKKEIISEIKSSNTQHSIVYGSATNLHA
jgi:hypothetical protein